MSDFESSPPPAEDVKKTEVKKTETDKYFDDLANLLKEPVENIDPLTGLGSGGDLGSDLFDTEPRQDTAVAHAESGEPAKSGRSLEGDLLDPETSQEAAAKLTRMSRRKGEKLLARSMSTNQETKSLLRGILKEPPMELVRFLTKNHKGKPASQIGKEFLASVRVGGRRTKIGDIKAAQELLYGKTEKTDKRNDIDGFFGRDTLAKARRKFNIKYDGKLGKYDQGHKIEQRRYSEVAYKDALGRAKNADYFRKQELEKILDEEGGVEMADHIVEADENTENQAVASKD